MTYLHWNKKFRTSIKNDVDCTLLCCYCARLDVITVINPLNWKLIFLLCFHWYNKFLVTSVDQDLQSLYKYFDRRWNIAVTSSDLKTVRSIATWGGMRVSSGFPAVHTFTAGTGLNPGSWYRMRFIWLQELFSNQCYTHRHILNETSQFCWNLQIRQYFLWNSSNSCFLRRIIYWSGE